MPGTRNQSAGRGPHPLLAAPALHGAFGPQSTVTLERLTPDGGARWRVTVVGEPAEEAGRERPTAAPPPPDGPMLTTTTAELVTRPESSFAIAAMILCGARLEVPAGDQAAAAEILACAAASAPAELELPGGRRVRPQEEELERLRRLLPRALAPGAKATSWVVVWLEAPPWAPAGAAPALPALAGDEYLVIPSAGHYAALQQALALNTFAPSEGSRFPRARLEKGGARGFAELRPVTPEQEMLMAPEEAAALASRVWQQRGELSDLDADVLDVISATWLRHGPRTASERVPERSAKGRRGSRRSSTSGAAWRRVAMARSASLG